MKLAALRSLREPRLPRVATIPPALDLPLGLFLGVFGFFLPFSVAGVSIMMLVLLLVAVGCAPAIWRSAPWRDPVMAVGLVLFGFIAVHTLAVSGTDPEGLAAINRYHELIMAPILFALFRLVSRPRAFLWGLLAGAVAYAIAHWVALGWPLLEGKIIARSISAGLILSLAAYVLFDEARTSRHPLVLYTLAAFLTVTVMLRVQGRTGLVILAFLLVYAFWSKVRPGWRAAIAVAVPTALVALALSLGAANRRLDESLAGFSRSAEAPVSSTLIRIKMLETSLEMARVHFLTGIGIARYPEVSEAFNRARELRETGKVGPEQPWTRTSNPHNEYLLQLVGSGVVSLVLFLTWIALQAARLQSSRPVTVLGAASGAFAIGCLFNSMLMDFTEGHFYVALMTWLLARTTSENDAVA